MHFFQDCKEITFKKGFYAGCYQVTQELYEKVTGGNPSLFKGKHRTEMRNKTLLFFYLTPFVLVAGLFVYNLNVQSKQTPPPKKKAEQTQVKTSKQQPAVPKSGK